MSKSRTHPYYRYSLTTGIGLVVTGVIMVRKSHPMGVGISSWLLFTLFVSIQVLTTLQVPVSITSQCQEPADHMTLISLKARDTQNQILFFVSSSKKMWDLFSTCHANYIPSCTCSILHNIRRLVAISFIASNSSYKGFIRVHFKANLDVRF